MQPERFNVDEAMAKITLEEAAARCGVVLQAKGSGKEVRIDCPFGCGADHAGRREISVNVDHPAKLWRCHAYGCAARGNLLALMHGFLTGARWTGERLQGEEFKRVREVLLGPKDDPPAMVTPLPRAAAPETLAEMKRNVPLKDAEKEATRGLVGLEEKFLTDPASMPPKASTYWRRRPYLTQDLCRRWGVGVLPMREDDKRGWSLRHHICYRFDAEDGETLAYVGRDPAFEEKDLAFQSLAKDARAKEKAPTKHRFPQGFHRGLELYGQQAQRLETPDAREKLERYGLILVEGFNDVLALDAHGIPAVAICSNRITGEQVEKAARLAATLAGGRLGLLFDCEERGDDGAKEALWLLTERGLQVRLGWSRAMHAGAFCGRQPEHLSGKELLRTILPALMRP